MPGVGEKTAAKLINEYGDLDTLYAHLDALSPKLRQNLADHADRVRINAEVIPLVRDVPLDVDVDDLVLGGWHHEAARAAFAELEMKGAWSRFESAMRDGLLGAPAEGEAVDGAGRRQRRRPRRCRSQPDWLAAPECRRAHAGIGRRPAALEELFAATKAGTGSRRPRPDVGGRPRPVAAARAWRWWPSRPIRPTTVAPPSTSVRTPAARWWRTRTCWPPWPPGSGPDGVGVVAHDVKELMRSCCPSASTSPAWSSTPRSPPTCSIRRSTEYRLSDLARPVPAGGRRRRHGGQGPGRLRCSRPSPRTSGEPGPTRARRHRARPGPTGRRAGPAAGPAARASSTTVGEQELFDDMERPLVRVLARMEVVGIPVDREVLRSIADELTAECASLEATMHELAGAPFNVNSVKQLRTVLYDDLGLSPGRKTKTGYSTDARTLESLRGQHPIIEVLLRYREVEKLRSTYGESLAAEVAADGRIHATFRQTVARTGRLSSDRPNLHNIPVRTDEGRRFREAFVPSPGRRLLVADYDQVELRAIAHLSGDPGLTSAFAAGEDIHRTVAARVFGVDRDEVTHEQRSTAKMVSYGLAYGMESYGLAQRLGVPVEEAKGILDAFFDGFPSVHDYMDQAVAEARADGYTVTAFGRRRPLPDLMSSNHQVRQAAERQAMNAGIQGLAADLFKMALIRLDSGLEEGGYRSDLVLQVHDEVLVDVEPDEADAVEAADRDGADRGGRPDGAPEGGHGLGLVVGRGQGLTGLGRDPDQRVRPACSRIVCLSHRGDTCLHRPRPPDDPAPWGRTRPESELPT